MRLIPHSRPTLGKDELESVINTISTGCISQGKLVENFEELVAGFIGVKGGVAVSSGTAGLHLALLALDIGKRDGVIIPDYTCTALLNAVKYVEATPQIVDIIPGEYSIDPIAVKKKVSKKTKAIILVHAFGLPADIKEIKSIGLPVIEDMAQAIGATYKGRMVGNFGELSVVSFYATKLMTTGEGGMVLSNSLSLLKKVRDLRDYDERGDYKVRYNYKMTDLQAAIGLVQLKRLPEFIKKRKEIASYYDETLKTLPISLPIFRKERGHVYYRYIVEVKKSLSAVISSLKRRGVDAKRPVYKPIHQYLQGKPLVNSLETWKKSLSIPIYPTLANDDREKVAKTMIEVLSE